MKKSQTIGTLVGILGVLFCFVHLELYSYSNKALFQGQVVHIEEDKVWVRTSSKLNEEDELLYVHGMDHQSKAILEVVSISPFYLETEVVDGNSVKIGDPVRGVYRWDSFQYLTDFLYERGNAMIRVQRNLIFPVKWSALDSLGKRQSFLTEEIESFKVSLSAGGFQVKEVIFKNRERVSLSNFWLRSLDPYQDKIIHLESDPETWAQLSGKHLTRVRILKRIRGAYRQITPSLDQQPFTSLGKQYRVQFNFVDYRLGIPAIEKRIVEEMDPDQKFQWIELLKEYDESQILGVGLSGSFNNWDFTQNPLTQNKHGFYETNVILEGGSYQYYFVIRVRGIDGEEIHLKVLDPSVPSTDDLQMDSSLASKTKVSKTKISKIKTLAYLRPGQSSVETMETVGVEGKASLIEIPTVVPILETTEENVSELSIQDLPFHLGELEREEASLATSWIEGDIQVGKSPYYRVQFQFDFLYRVRTQIKRQINAESQKDSPDKKTIDQLYLLLRLYNERRVRNVYVSGTFNQWEKTPLNKNSDNSWSLERFVPAERHLYHYWIETGLSDYPFYSIPNLYSNDREENDLGVESSVLDLSEEMQEEQIQEQGEENMMQGSLG